MARKQRSVADKTRQVLSRHRRHLGPAILRDWGLLVPLFLLAPLIPAVLFAGWKASDPYIIYIGIAAFLALAMMGLLTLLLWRLHQSPAEVRLYPFSIRWKAGGVDHDYDYEEISEVYRNEVITISNAGRSRRTSLTIHFEDGQILHCTNVLSRYDDLVTRVLADSANALLPRAREDFRTRGVVFGRIAMDRDGIEIDGDSYAWDKLKQTRIVNGHLVFYFPKKQEYEMLLSTVPNYLVLFALLEEFGKRPVVGEGQLLFG